MKKIFMGLCAAILVVSMTGIFFFFHSSHPSPKKTAPLPILVGVSYNQNSNSSNPPPAPALRFSFLPPAYITPSPSSDASSSYWQFSTVNLLAASSKWSAHQARITPQIGGLKIEFFNVQGQGKGWTFSADRAEVITTADQKALLGGTIDSAILRLGTETILSTSRINFGLDPDDQKKGINLIDVLLTLRTTPVIVQTKFLKADIESVFLQKNPTNQGGSINTILNNFSAIILNPPPFFPLNGEMNGNAALNFSRSDTFMNASLKVQMPELGSGTLTLDFSEPFDPSDLFITPLQALHFSWDDHALVRQMVRFVSQGAPIEEFKENSATVLFAHSLISQVLLSKTDVRKFLEGGYGTSLTINSPIPEGLAGLVKNFFNTTHPQTEISFRF